MTYPADNTLAYMDQGSYLGLRALRRGPVIQYVWIYERGVDMDGLRRFHRNLADGLLGRLVERSVIPFGRHHWVSSGEPGGIEGTAKPMAFGFSLSRRWMSAAGTWPSTT